MASKNIAAINLIYEATGFDVFCQLRGMNIP
jgi:hypothetical protein